MKLRYAATCRCGRDLAAGTRAGYDRTTRTVTCMDCLADGPEPNQEVGKTSLERTYESRKTNREERVKERFPRAGRLLLAITPEPASTLAFKKGAEGERKAAERILGRAGDNALFQTNRLLGADRSDGDIDMLAVTPRGVVVIDVKHYKDAKVEVRTRGGILSPRTQKLYVGGRDKTEWLDSLDKQREAVQAGLAATDVSGVPLYLTLCFVDADLPLLERPSIRDVSIYGARQLGRKLSSATGPYEADQRAVIHAALAEALPRA